MSKSKSNGTSSVAASAGSAFVSPADSGANKLLKKKTTGIAFDQTDFLGTFKDSWFMVFKDLSKVCKTYPLPYLLLDFALVVRSIITLFIKSREPNLKWACFL